MVLLFAILLILVCHLASIKPRHGKVPASRKLTRKCIYQIRTKILFGQFLDPPRQILFYVRPRSSEELYIKLLLDSNSEEMKGWQSNLLGATRLVAARWSFYPACLAYLTFSRSLSEMAGRFCCFRKPLSLMGLRL